MSKVIRTPDPNPLFGKLMGILTQGFKSLSCKLDKLIDLTIESDQRFDYELVCLTNDGGITIQHGLIVYDMTVNSVTATYYIGGVPVTGYEITDCQVPIDREDREHCYKALSTTPNYQIGDTLTKIDTFDVSTNPDTYISTIWYNIRTGIYFVQTFDELLFESCDTVICSPLQNGFYGDNSTITEFDSIFIDIPKCCQITYTTSAGSVTLPLKEQNWIFTQSFNCLVNGYTITSDCDIDNVYTLLTKTK